MNGKRAWLGMILLAICAWAGVARPQADDEAARKSQWEKDIAAFEAWDAKNAWPRDAVLFVGSSSIRMWRTAESFPDLPVINRGFGGSQTADVVEFMDRIVIKYAPRLIVFYAGDNDISAGKSPQQVFRDYKAFVARVQEALPRTCIIYMAIKPSGSRWALWEKMAEANRLIKEYSVDDTRLFFVDGATPLLGAEGTPDEAFYVADQLHLSDAGYKVWTELLAPIRLVKEVDLQTQSLALVLIKQGMGPHNVPPERLATITLEKKAPETNAQAAPAPATPADPEVHYVASKTSKVFHKSTCRFAGSISETNRQTFSGREQAAAAGRRPCRTCNP
jgi:lysophospholipase L1-like esterase